MSGGDLSWPGGDKSWSNLGDLEEKEELAREGRDVSVDHMGYISFQWN